MLKLLKLLKWVHEPQASDFSTFWRDFNTYNIIVCRPWKIVVFLFSSPFGFFKNRRLQANLNTIRVCIQSSLNIELALS